ncbi:replication initiation protein [Nocardia higoensis]|uniref:replication initiation protein n=1 Tax=Nocardia higoensis TaxID=228599 RepID=UPI000592CD02|nr:replication initiation protein [Nocardia higoensis]
MQIEVTDADWIEVDAPPLPFEEYWLPRRPLAGKSKSGGYYRTSRERALTLPYIESNPSAARSLVITDHDGGMADEIVAHTGLPQPSYIALNRHTRSGHIVYALETPVIMTDAARRAPVNLLSRIEAGLNDVLAGDVAYGCRTTKNPRHADHLTLWGPDYAVYKLKDIAGPLDELGALPKYKTTMQRRKALRTSSAGRNVELFELSRRWSYRRRGDYEQLEDWIQVVQDYAWDRNLDVVGSAFDKGPMLEGEVNQIGRSIATWTWRNIKHTFREIQAIRGRNGGLVVGPTIPTEELARRGRVGGRATSEAKTAAAQRNARKFDLDAIIAAALKG